MIDTKKIIEAAERKLQGTDMFVVGCTCTPGNEIELLIDSDTSVAIEACAELSRAVEAEFDRDEEDFSLTVASAGIGSELKSLRQYRKLIGGTSRCCSIQGSRCSQNSMLPTTRASRSRTRRSRPSKARNASSW